MLFDSQEPITVPCAQTVEPAIHSLLRLGIMQEEFVDHLSRALGIVRCVLDHEQSIPRSKLAALGRSLWARIPQIESVPEGTVEQVRSIIMACVGELRELSEETSARAEADLPLFSQSSTSVRADDATNLVAVREPPATAIRETAAAVTAPPLKEDSQEREGFRFGTKGLFGTLPPRRRPYRDAFNRTTGAPSPPRPSRPSHRQRSLFDAPLPEPVQLDLPLAPPPVSPEPEPLPADTALTSPLIVPATTEPSPLRVDIASGERAKARDIVAAINLLKSLEREGRSPLPAEREQLAKFAGFGPVALSIFPNPVSGRYKDAAWQTLGEELQGLLTPAEYESAKRTTFNAFYTSPEVVVAIHAAIARLGVPADATVLEPGCGIGNFLSAANPSMRCIGVEMDSISGRIARQLHPESTIRIENFRDTKLPVGSIDAVVGNVPFADLKLDYGGQKFALHDFFLAKSVDLLRPGGVLAAVTSHFTLDKQGGAAREYLAEKADFVGAIRLPSDAFKRQGTQVVTDILFLRRRSDDDAPQHRDPDWLAVGQLPIEGVEVLINRYFLKHPEMVLGRFTRKDTLYGEGYSVAATGDLALQLEAALDRLPEFPPLPPRSPVPSLTDASPQASPDQPVSEGSFVTDDDGTICQWIDGQAVPVVYAGVPLSARGTLTGRRMAALIGLRDHARRVLQSQNEDWPQAQRDRARFELNYAYDRFTAQYGPINKTTFGSTKNGGEIRRMPNLVKFREDPDAMLVMSLEHYDESTGKAMKSEIMTRDVVGRIPDVTSVTSAEEGLLVCLNQRGDVDLPFISDLYGKPEDTIVAELGDLTYRDPESKRWQTADAYLSGNVRAKLAAALSAGGDYARNAEALAAVQPEDVLPGDIDCNLGAPWIPAGDIRSFAAELFRVDGSVIDVGRLAKDAVWSIAAGAEAEASVAATSEYGTARAHGVWLLDLALNMKTPVIYDTVMVGDREERVVNQEETLAAREKQRQIKERFRSWVFSDPERTERLVRLYNDTFNNLRPRLFDGSHLDFPGMNQVISLMSHQRAAVWRCMCAGNTLLAQTVGAGKTFIMAAAGMKMKQAGLIRKPLYVVPNHMLEQFGREFLLLYPNSKLLITGKDDLARDRRKLLTAKIASNEWDGIVVTHSSFERVGMSRDYQAQFLRDQISSYSELLRDAAAGNTDRASRNLIKTIEKQKARHEERLRELLAEHKKDDGLVFDELGIDYLFIDEAQYCKNLETPSKMQRVAGIQTGGSERAFDLFMKTRFLYSKHPGHGVTFATGTPISNSMVEMYTMQRYLDPAGMEARGIDHFDAWAATFGEVVDAMEISPDGASLKPRSRFAKFTNLPELQQMFRFFADVQTADMLDLPRPMLETGKAQIVACPMSSEQRAMQQELVERYERLRSQRIHPSVDNALAITTDGRKLALEARLLDGSAPDFPGSKVNALVHRVLMIWRDTSATRSTQLVFCDLGVHATATGYSVYDDVTEKLRAGGMPQSEIAAIGDADSDGKKQALFERVRSGSVRVLLGSTQKMGMGTNVQKRLIALHHLDAPWKPAEVEQREGRILRQGNENDTVAIYRYVTEGSFDAFMWQALETKARFIAQVMTGQSAVRRSDDVGSVELSYAEVKAIASGNPAVLTLAEADSELQRLAVLKKNHTDEQYLALRRLRDLPKTISELQERLSGLEADGSVITNAGRNMVIADQAVPAGGVLAALAHTLESLPPRVSERRPIPLGRYGGLAFGVILYPHFPPEVFLDRATMRTDPLSRDHQGPRAVLNALERLAGSYEQEAARVRQNLVIAEAQLRDYQGRSGEPFAHEAYLTELTALRDSLRSSLSATSKAAAIETGPTMLELADKIKALLTGKTIDALPKRTSSLRTSMAAEPITEQIRRRIDLALTA